VSAHSPGNSEYPVRGARVSAELVRSTSESGRPPISHLVLAYSEVEPATPREPEPAPAPLPRTVRMPPFPDAWPPLAGPGDPIPSSVGGERFVFEPGARLVGPPSSIGSVTGGFEMVLELTGDPQRVVDAYRTQFEHAGFTPVRAPFGDDAPGTGPSARYTQSGGGEVSAITVTGDDGHRFLWLTRAND
jgi:hypothetical protein